MYQLAIVIPTYSIGVGLINPVADSLLTSSVEPAEQFLVLALSVSSHALLQAVTPAIGGFILENYGFRTLGILGVLGAASVLITEYFIPVLEKLQSSSKYLRRNLAHYSIRGRYDTKSTPDTEEKMPIIA